MGTVQRVQHRALVSPGVPKRFATLHTMEKHEHPDLLLDFGYNFLFVLVDLWLKILKSFIIFEDDLILEGLSY